MDIILSESLRENSTDISSIQYTTDTVLYLLETYFKNDGTCDYMKQAMIMICKNGRHAVMSPIIQISGNIIVVSKEKWHISKINDKYLRFFPDLYEFGSEVYLTEINKMDLYHNSSKRDCVESSYYVEKEGVIIRDVNIRYHGICK